MIEVFNATKAALQAQPIFKHVALFRNQVRHIIEGDEIPFRCPACLIEFVDVTYDTNADRTQTGNGILRIYLTEFDLVKADEDFFNLRDTVFTTLQELRDEEKFTRLMRIRENPDPEFEAFSVWTIDFAVSWADNGGQATRVPVTVNTLTLTPDLP